MRYPIVLAAILVSVLCHAAIILSLHHGLVQERPPLVPILGSHLQPSLITVVRAQTDEATPDPETTDRLAASAPLAGKSTLPATADPAYWPPEDLERQPVPVSAPDAQMLEGYELPSSLVRLRLFIDARGVVHSVMVKAQDAADWSPLQRMFEATRFIPGRRGGQDVASWVEIEVNVSDLVRVL